jgi:hypothetical protein
MDDSPMDSVPSTHAHLHGRKKNEVSNDTNEMIRTTTGMVPNVAEVATGTYAEAAKKAVRLAGKNKMNVNGAKGKKVPLLTVKEESNL